MRSRTLLATLIGSAFGAAPAAAQVTAQLWLGAGTIADDRGISATAVSAAPSIAIASPHARLQVGLHGTRFTTGSWSLGAGTSLDLRAPVAGPAALTLGAAAGATRTSH